MRTTVEPRRHAAAAPPAEATLRACGHAAHDVANADAAAAVPRAGEPKRGRPRGAVGARPPVLLRALAGTQAGGAGAAVHDALQRVWLDGFIAGAASVAPGRVKRCQRCDEPFVAGDRRERYCGVRCRNTVLKRRYRARLRARSGGHAPGR